MSKYEAIKAATNAYIKTNGRQEITGAILNAVMIATIDSLGRFYQFVGSASPDTDPGTIDQNIAYLASTPGTYTHLGGITIDAGEFSVIKFDGVWKKEVIVVIPAKVSQLENDLGFITNAVSDLVNYYTKAETFSKAEVASILSGYYDKDEVDSIVSSLTRQSYVVAWDGTAEPVVGDIPSGVSVTWGGNPYVGTLPASASTTNKIYLVSNGAGYDEYITTDNSGYAWVNIGTTSLDLSGYATKAELTQLEQKVGENARIVSLVGQGDTGVYTGLPGLEGGHRYRIWIDSWNTDQLTSSWSNLSFYVRYDNNGSYVYLYTISVPVSIPKYVDITLPDNVTSIEIGGRINSGENALVRLEDTSALQMGRVSRKLMGNPISGYISTNSATITGYNSSTTYHCIFIPVREGEQYMISGEGGNSNTLRLFALFSYDAIANNFVRGLTFGSSGDFRTSPRFVVIPSGVTHMAVNLHNYNSNTDGVWLINNPEKDGDHLMLPFEFGGMNNQRRVVNLNNVVVPGHTYRIIPDVWDASAVTGTNTILGVYIDLTTRISDKITLAGQTLSKFYDFSIPKNLDLSTHSVDVAARANFGFRASFFIQDITAQEVELFPLSGADGAMATFMDAVQRKSDNIGLTSSTWNNPYGGRLYGFNRTSVKDLLKATIYAAGNPRLMDIMGATETKVRVWGEHARVVTITNDIPTQLATYYQTLHGSDMPYKILANKAGAHANEDNPADNGFSLLVVAIVSGHYVAAVVGIGNTSQGYSSGRTNRVKGMIELLDIVKAYYDGTDISGMSVVSCEKAIASELPSDVFPQCYRKDAITPIHSQDADTIFMPASTSKLMAAITMVDFLEMGDFYRITDNADEVVNDSDYTAYAGDVQSVETSFYAMLMASNGANTLSLARIAGEKILNKTTSLV